MLLSDVRQVTLHYVSGAPVKYLVLASEVERFVEASKRLHFNPGKNPHNGVETAKVWKITSAKLEFRGPFWWTVPDLQNNNDPAGARIIDSAREEQLFIDHETVNRWHAEEAEAEAAMYRERERQAREAVNQ
jgi:hypothetical protein